jgi:hypothetical protein
VKPSSSTTKSKLDDVLDANSGGIPRASAGGRQGVENVLTLIILRTALRIRELGA